MVKFENDCCDCAVPAYPCRGNSCPLRHVRHLYCDRCGSDVETLFNNGSEELCEDCLLEWAKEQSEEIN